MTVHSPHPHPGVRRPFGRYSPAERKKNYGYEYEYLTKRGTSRTRKTTRTSRCHVRPDEEDARLLVPVRFSRTENRKLRVLVRDRVLELVDSTVDPYSYLHIPELVRVRVGVFVTK
eukprot:scaffold528709_cov36-Prasinocladus_malaysianus.AAC.1